GLASVAFRGDDSLNARAGNLVANGIRIIAPVGEEGLDPVGNHPEQGCKALSVVRLPGRQDEAERSPLRIASGMELGGEAAARSAKRLGRLRPLFMPTAQ